MGQVRIGLVGLGGMGAHHARALFAGGIPGAVLAGVADIDPAWRQFAVETFGGGMPVFASAAELAAAGVADAWLIATPHPCHVELSVLGLESGLHVLCEKPAGVHVAEVERLNAVADRCDRVFAIMFNQRTANIHRKIKALIEQGELGAIRRFQYTITDWFRTQRYYDSGGWRATWRGEGGGVLLNQCPHNLDLMQWWFGLPLRLRAFCAFGKYHEIEVEDEVTAFLEYAGGTTGVFVTTTGEAPGVKRLEIAGDRGRLVMEEEQLTFLRTVAPVQEFCARSEERFVAPEVWRCAIPVAPDSGSQHEQVIAAFAAKIRGCGELVARGQEGADGS